MTTTTSARAGARQATVTDVMVGVAAGLVSWAGMAGWASLGVSLAGFGAAVTPAAMALAVGGSAGISQDLGRAALTGSISVLPLGISLVGAVLLAVLLTTWLRVAGAAAAFVVGLVVLVFLPAGQLDVRPGPTLFGGLLWLAVVLGLRVAMWWVPRVRYVVLVLLGAAGVAAVVGALASIAGGARVLGTMVLAAPNLLCVALTRGLGTAWSVHGPDLPLPTVETGGLGPIGAPVWPLTVLAAVVVVLVAVFAGWHAPWVAAVCFGGMALLGGANVAFHAGPFAIELGVGGNVFVAAGVGLLAGLAACLLVEGVRYWHRQHP
ncbi:hypothetical protein [Actinophytocola oryzae]|uniref:Uncharacterized protein n=1 Tax=Actinophytocola oryzae TaxID=502181 RepID=A0A4R7V7B9_9PSEU|nr:hypothetical protein [Actinophytocola oryzae]TDV44812.1 hypothetical protein CLV71_11371 [Actinophytocola oryzae]